MKPLSVTLMEKLELNLDNNISLIKFNLGVIRVFSDSLQLADEKAKEYMIDTIKQSTYTVEESLAMLEHVINDSVRLLRAYNNLFVEDDSDKVVVKSNNLTTKGLSK